MKAYNKTDFVAKVKEPFTMSDDDIGLFQLDEYNVPADDSVVHLKVGQHLEYFFTGRNGFHFVYYGEEQNGFGFWVHPDLVEIEAA